jgi:hypothetical protein
VVVEKLRTVVYWVGRNYYGELSGERYYKPKDAHEYYGRLDVMFDQVFVFKYSRVKIVIVASGEQFFTPQVKRFADAVAFGKVKSYAVNLREL